LALTTFHVDLAPGLAGLIAQRRLSGEGAPF
jgi:hypothetical protein